MARRHSVTAPPPLNPVLNFVPLGLSLVLTGLAFLGPSNLFYKFDWLPWAVRGLRIDYLLPKIYLTDIFLIFGLILAQFGLVVNSRIQIKPTLKLKKLGWFWQQFDWWQLSWWLGLGLLLIRQGWTGFPIVAVMSLGRLLALGWLAQLTQKFWSQLKHDWIWWGLAVGHIFQSLVAGWQFLTQHSVGSYRWLLGEPSLTQTYGVVQGNFGRLGELTLPYGTTAHPNILAGWLVGSWLLLFTWWLHQAQTSMKPLLILSQMAILSLTGSFTLILIWATQSWSALGLLVTGLIWLGGSRWFLAKRPEPTEQKCWPAKFTNWSLMMLLVILMASPWWLEKLAQVFNFNPFLQHSLSWERRIWLNQAAVKLWLKQPWWGLGLSQFTAQLETVTPPREIVRFVQPVHQVFWLWLSETGMMGVLTLVAGWKAALSRRLIHQGAILAWLWIFFPVLIWDHYLLTLPTGLWLGWWWWVSLNAQWSKNHQLSTVS
ncbi:MAG TPA: hypothetical protein DEP87_03885 [Candidatus Pacebacteria bacterium]|nr:hypothetical protein [Candidatus Paceibacterota bacterium]